MQMMIDIDQLNTEALAAPANRPVIGITGNFNEGQLKLLPGYFRSIEAAGGTYAQDLWAAAGFEY